MRCNGRRLLNYKQRMEKEEKGVPWVLQLVAASPPPAFSAHPPLPARLRPGLLGLHG